MSNYKIEFPLWIVIDPTSASQAGDIVLEMRDFAHLEDVIAGGAMANRTLQGRNPTLYTDGIAAHAGAADRLRKRDGKPEWVPLSSLRPGTVFEAQSGWRGVKTADEAPALGIAWCTELGNGKRVQTHIGTIVKEIL